jgi:hypothetical protein
MIKTNTCLGLAFSTCLLIFYFAVSWTTVAGAQAAKAKCEKSLPRDQHCVLTAVPSIETKQPINIE